MKHSEFMGKFFDSGYYTVPELDKVVYATRLSRELLKIGMTPETWYEKYVPNPGCIVCNTRCPMNQLSYGWNVTCGDQSCISKVQSDWSSENINTELMASALRDKWKDPEFRDRRISEMSNHASSQWHDPEFRMLNFLGKCSASNILEASVYVCTLPTGHVKFGVSHDPIQRLNTLYGKLEFCTAAMPVVLAASLEYDIACKFPESSTIDYNGKHEIRDGDLLPNIIEYIEGLIND